MDLLIKALPTAGTMVAVLVTMVVAHWFLNRGEAARRGSQFRNQLIMLGLTALGLLLILMVVPIGDATRGQVLSLIGIVVSAAIALSSTTFLGNAMAGVMLRAVRSFRMGDFIRCGEHFGRVSERGLFHTEIQTAHRDLTTLPNLYLVTHPVTTVRPSGTIVSTSLSLGYDVPHQDVERLLLEAARSVDLAEPYVHIESLGDFSIAYRVHGLLTEVKHVLSARSQLRAAVVDHLHAGGIEIVSPSFMNQRVFDPGATFIPEPASTRSRMAPRSKAEDVVFDKADEAASIDALRKARDAAGERRSELKAQLKTTAENERAPLDRELETLDRRIARLDEIITDRESRVSDED